MRQIPKMEMNLKRIRNYIIFDFLVSFLSLANLFSMLNIPSDKIAELAAKTFSSVTPRFLSLATTPKR